MEIDDKNADLLNFTKQLLDVEIMMEKASKYNQTLAFQIEKMRKIVNCNEKMFGKQEAGDQNIKSHKDGLGEMMTTNWSKHAMNIQEKVKSFTIITYLRRFNNIASSFLSQVPCSRILKANSAKKKIRISSCANS